jgi:hypothetical protein
VYAQLDHPRNSEDNRSVRVDALHTFENRTREGDNAAKVSMAYVGEARVMRGIW